MVHRMDSAHTTKVKVKSEVDDAAAREHSGPPDKRPKLDVSLQGNLEAVPAEYNPLSEPSPLGLRLKKSPSLLELIQMRLSQEHASKSSSKTHKGNSTDKLKASNFPASLLTIGTWEYKSKYEGDLVAKCYFAKHKLVWEVLDGALKNKIEIQWSDIVAIKANYAVEGTDTLDVVLARQPLFFRETNPQPRKHTLWQPTSDFTTGQASLCRHHLLHCPQGLLGRHFEKLTQCDPRLNFLSQQPEIVLESPYFDPKVPVFHESIESKGPFGLNREEGSPFFAISGAQSSSSKNESQDFLSSAPDNYSSSPSSVMDTVAIEDLAGGGAREPSNMLGQWGQVKALGIPPSISMDDLVNHIGHCIAEQRATGNSLFSGPNQLNSDVLEDITRYLLNDSQASVASDEQSLMSRVNSLCCLLQKDPATLQNVQMKKGNTANKAEEGSSDPAAEICDEAARAMSRKDSVGDLLLNLPRIASLPHILPVVSEDPADQQR